MNKHIKTKYIMSEFKSVVIDGIEYVPKDFTGITKKYSNTHTVKADESNVVDGGSKDWKITEYKLGDNIWKVEDFGKTWIIDNAKMEIHSVKRLSDNSVWTIGDEIIFDNIPFQIEGFSVEFGKLMHVKIKHNGIVDIGSLKKQKLPLFTTEDGKPIYNGDEYFVVFLNGWFSYEPYEDIIKVEGDIELANYKNDCKTFSTKEAANTYIVHKKLTLSYDDISEWHKKYFNPLYYESFMEGLEELVKSKINK